MVITYRVPAIIFEKHGGQYMCWLLLIVVLVNNIACQSSGDESNTSAQERLVHPIPTAIPGFSNASDFVTRNRPSERKDDNWPMVQALSMATETMTLGVLEGDKHQMFGQIVDIKVDGDGNLYVLDSQFREVRVYSADGTYLYAIGRAGQGPDEFSAPKALDVGPSGRVIVADRSTGIKIFERTGDTHWLVATVPLPFEPQDICVENNVLHVQGSTADDPRAIFRFTLSGDALSSFGTAYDARSELVRLAFTRGQIVCMRQPSSVMYFPSWLPVIYGYSYDGDLQWVTKDTDFESLPVEEQIASSGQSRVSMNVRANTYDMVVSAVPLPEGQVIVQIAHLTPESVAAGGDRYAEIRTHVMSALTGEASFAGNSLPLVYAVTATRMYTARQNPFPQIIIYRFPRPLEPVGV